MKFQTRVLSGRLPLMKLFRDGEQTCCCTYARRKTSERAASRSMLGVIMNGWITPRLGLRSSAITSSTLRAPLAGAGGRGVGGGGVGGGGVGGAVLFPAVPLVAAVLSVAPALLDFRWQHPLLAAPPLHLATGLYVK